jgi:A/G-specific adenine glycosylase
LPEAKTQAVRHAVLDWYRAGHRDLPWRHTRDPYAILVSELMLQQTQVDRVLPKYREFLERYPSLEALAAAGRDDVIRTWKGLGYNLRAVRLHEIARQAVASYGGRLPDTLAGLLALKGIGRYTAAAVACFAFGAAEPVMDTNVRRVLGRIFADTAPTAVDDDRLAWQVAEAALPRTDETDAYDPGAVYDWNQALMDLGATVCLARNPRCLSCPAHDWCTARAAWFLPEGTVTQPGLPMVAEARVAYVAPPSQNGARPRVPTKRRPAPKPEERFEGSRRWYRGRIVDALRNLPTGTSATIDQLGPSIKPDYSTADRKWLMDLVSGLAKDGLADVNGAAGEHVTVALPR